MKLYPGRRDAPEGQGAGGHRFVVVRENTGDVYTGTGGVSMKGTPTKSPSRPASTPASRWTAACATLSSTRRSTARKRRARRQEHPGAVRQDQRADLHLRPVGARLPRDGRRRIIPDIKRDYYHVDATCMWMVKNPEWFDVIVTGNMFGDIITDLGAMIQGGMGIAAGGNINPEGVSHVRAHRRQRARSTPARTSSIRWPRSARCR